MNLNLKDSGTVNLKLDDGQTTLELPANPPISWGEINGEVTDQNDLVNYISNEASSIADDRIDNFESTFSDGSIIYADGTNLTEDNPNLFWDRQNNRLGIGTNTPSELADINGILNIQDRVIFQPISSPSYREGQLWYSQETNTLSFQNDRSATTLNIGEENWLRVRNNTGQTITNGSVVYISGFHDSGGMGLASGYPEISLAKADSINTSDVSGLATEDIPDGESGMVATQGMVRGVDTSSFSVGDTLYLSANTAGALTNVQPDSPNFSIRMGQVSRSHMSAGQILVDLGRQREAIYSHGSIPFADSNGLLVDDNSNLYWDNQNNRLGVGTTTPSNRLTVSGDANITNDLTVGGNLTVNGTTFTTKTETAEIEDNLGFINFGETGSGITEGFAGWEIDRGDLNPYRWGYNESNDLWKLGEFYTDLTYSNLSGTFNTNEEIIGQTSNARAYIVTDSSSVLRLKGKTNNFSVSEQIVGQTSGATADVSSLSETNDLQAVATREDSPNDNSLAIWNDTNSMFETDSNLTWDGTDLSIGGNPIWHSGDFTSTQISNWDTAYNRSPTGISGGGNGTFTLTKQDNTTLTANLSHTHPKSDLPSSIAYEDESNTFTQSQTFNSDLNTNLTQGSVPFIGSGGTLTEDNSNLYWNSTNNRLGIGNSNPQAKLHLTEDQDSLTSIRLDNTNASGSMALDLYDGSNQRAEVNYDTASALLNLGTHINSGQISLSTATDSEAVRIDSNGNMGIIRGDIEMNGNNIQTNGGWLSGDGGNEGVYVFNDGHVGIGTDQKVNPIFGNRLMTIEGIPAVVTDLNVASPYIGMQDRNDNQNYFNYGMSSYSGDPVSSSGITGFFNTGSSSSGRFDMRFAGNEQFFFYGDGTFVTQGTGNVGIGVRTPSSKLDVDGDARFTGAVTAESGLTISGANPALTISGTGPGDIGLRFDSSGGGRPITFFENGNFRGGLDYNYGENQFRFDVTNASGGREQHAFVINSETDNNFVGLGTPFPNSRLHVNGSVSKPIRTITSDTTAGNSDYTFIGDTSSNSITVTLPSASSCEGRIYVFKKISSSNNLTIDPNSTETIDGATTYDLTADDESAQIQSDGSGQWFVISDNK